MVILDGNPLGKPKDYEDAFSMLRSLSGREHQVLTGCAILGKGTKELFYDYAYVTFNQMTDQEIK